MNTFEKLVSGKSVSYVPIYSMFNHQSGKINLTCDGNVNRWMTSFSKSNCTELKIFGPKENICENWSDFMRRLKLIRGKTSFIQTKFIEKSAGTQRSDLFGNNFLKCFSSKLLFQDNIFQEHMIIAEGQGLIRSLLAAKQTFNSYRKTQISTFDRLRQFPEIAFWCPVCQTNKKTRSFFGKSDKEENEKIFREVDYVIVASKDQVEYLNEIKIPSRKIVYSPIFIDRDLEIFKKYKKDIKTIERINNLGNHVIYLPFRLSDEGYRLWEIIEATLDFSKTPVICPNVNGSTDSELIKLCTERSSLEEVQVSNFLRKITSVDPSRDTYYSIIDNCENVVIPYFEDTDFVMHAAVDELLRGKKKPICKVVQTREDFIKEIER